MSGNRMLLVKTFFGCFFQVCLFALGLLIPAKTWYWVDAIIFLGVHSVMLFSASVYLCLYYPNNIKSRLVLPYASNQPKEDKFATTLIVMALSFGFICVPLDVFHFQIFSRPNFEFKCLGLILHFFGFIVVIQTIVQNEFAQPMVMIQGERGHVLIDSGLYSYIRHPMYFGFVLYIAGMALWLGSIFMATLGTLIIMLAFIPRILIEEKTLKSKLAGYEDYLQRVKCRIIPMVI